MRVKIICIAILFSLKNFANDTLLTNVFVQDYYYNLVQTKDSDVFVSSNTGLYKLNSGQLDKVGEEKGYVKFQNGKFVVSPFLAIETHFGYKNLLPRSYNNFPRQSIELKDFIYIISRGDLFVFKKAEYSFLMKGVSVRCFTKNSIGTYDGVFCYEKKLDIPTYTSGKIHEVDSTFFICYDGLAIYKKGKEPKLYTRELTGETQIGNEALGFARNIYKLKSGGYLFSSTKGLYILSDSLNSVELIKLNENTEAPIIIDVTENEYNSTITFSISNKLFRYGLKSKELDHLIDVESPILDGLNINKNKAKTSEFILLTELSLISVDLLTTEKTVICRIAGAHTILLLGDNTVLATSNDGAFTIDLVTQKVVHVFQGVEFNKLAAWRNNNELYLGSTEGYIKISISKLNSLVEVVGSGQAENQSFFIFKVLGLILLVTSLAFYIYIYPRSQISTKDPTVSKKEIEEYIGNNLNQVTIDSIANYFGISIKTLYSTVLPHKPGKLITEKRLSRAKELKLRGASISSISEITGFSMSYLKKLKY